MELKASITKRSFHSPLICQICGDIARGMNFDVITCMSCKAFFRRHALRLGKNLRCLLENNCMITKQTRGACGACRLKKCFTFGMNSKLIRSANNQLFKSSPSNFYPQPKPLNLLNHDQSLLTYDEWNLLSNIVHAYDEQNLAIRTQCHLKEQSSLPLKIRSKQNNTLQIIGSFYTAIQPFVERSPYFLNLPSDIRRMIIQNNLHGTGSFNSILAAIDSNAHADENYMANCYAIYGKEYVEEGFRFLLRVEPNKTLLKILLMIEVFSNNCSLVSYDRSVEWVNISIVHSRHLLHIQNIFVTMLWKYLVYQYGYFDAIRCFIRLVKNYLDTLTRTYENHSTQHWQMVDTIVEQTVYVSLADY